MTESPVPTYTVETFNALFSELDLNPEMQERYAITNKEYLQLQHAWTLLSGEAQASLMDSQEGWQDFAVMLLYDLHFDTPWETHVRKATDYGAINLSLTVSRYKNTITVDDARKTLVDLLRTGPSIIEDGQFTLSEDLKSQARQRAGRKALDRLLKWEELINAYQHSSAMEKLTAVSNFFEKHIRETADPNENEGNDYWQSPVESLVRGKGDCDDFAIAHYVTLRLLGIPASQLRIVIVENPGRGGHGVTFFYPSEDANPWVLDNLPSDRLGPDFSRLQRLSVRTKADGIIPKYSFNEHMMGEFKNGEEALLTYSTRAFFPAFDTALLNSKSMLPGMSAEVNIAGIY